MTDRLISDLEAADLLSCSRSTIWRWAKSGTLPRPLRIGGASRWRFSDLQTLIDRADAARIKAAASCPVLQ